VYHLPGNVWKYIHHYKVSEQFQKLFRSFKDSKYPTLLGKVNIPQLVGQQTRNHLYLCDKPGGGYKLIFHYIIIYALFEILQIPATLHDMHHHVSNWKTGNSIEFVGAKATHTYTHTWCTPTMLVFTILKSNYFYRFAAFFSKICYHTKHQISASSASVTSLTLKRMQVIFTSCLHIYSN
jgi:hypothetical protein